MRRFTRYPSSSITASTNGMAISFKAVQAYLSDSNTYNSLNPYEKKILARAANSADYQVYLVSAAETLDLTNVPISDAFRKVIDIVMENWEF